MYLSDGAPEMEFLGQSINGYNFARYWQNPDQSISVPLFPGSPTDYIAFLDFCQPDK